MTLKRMIMIMTIAISLPISAFANSEINSALDNVFSALTTTDYKAAANTLAKTIINQDKNGVSVEESIISISQHITMKIEHEELLRGEVVRTLAFIEPILIANLELENSARQTKRHQQNRGVIVTSAVIFGVVGGVVGWRMGKNNNLYKKFIKKITESEGANAAITGHTSKISTSRWSVLSGAGPAVGLGIFTGGIIATIKSLPDTHIIDPYFLEPMIQHYDNLIDSK